MNHVWPLWAAPEKRKSFNGRKVTASLSFEAMDLRSWLQCSAKLDRLVLMMTFCHLCMKVHEFVVGGGEEICKDWIWKRMKSKAHVTRR